MLVLTLFVFIGITISKKNKKCQLRQSQVGYVQCLFFLVGFVACRWLAGIVLNPHLGSCALSQDSGQWSWHCLSLAQEQSFSVFLEMWASQRLFKSPFQFTFFIQILLDIEEGKDYRINVFFKNALRILKNYEDARLYLRFLLMSFKLIILYWNSGLKEIYDLTFTPRHTVQL